jgi:4-amino-4-deoxy-L-arabinose transferase-like glycosyltransferase
MSPSLPDTLRSRLETHGRLLFLILSLILALTALTARGLVALGTPDVLDWDETYYASTTATAAHGLGLYPYALGYPPIHDMGGMGYVVFLYVLAYKLLGPHLSALRLVSLCVSVLAVTSLFVLTRRWYGATAGLAALALAPSLLLFQLSNTIRFDVFAIAFVAWSLVLYSHSADRQRSLGWYIVLGLVFALGLEVHLHTAAAAFAVGFVFLARAIRDRGTGAAPLIGFVTGYAAGFLLFLAVNVLPDPHGFFRTAALARLSAIDSAAHLNLTAPMDASTLAKSFLSPAILVPKEIERYGSMASGMRWWELALWLCALIAFFLRRPNPAAWGRTLLLGAVLGGGIVFNSASPLYAASILPFFVPALGAFVAQGFASSGPANRDRVSGGSVALMLVLSIAILPHAVSTIATATARLRQPDPAVPTIVRMVKVSASPECILAGPADLYAPYFMDYPRFVGTRDVEVLIGSTYHELQDRPVAYWYEKRPDLAFGTPGRGMAAYLTEAKYERIADDLWKKPDGLSTGCSIAATDQRPVTGPDRRP